MRASFGGGNASSLPPTKAPPATAAFPTPVIPVMYGMNLAIVS